MAVRRDVVGENWAEVRTEWTVILPFMLILLVVLLSPLLYDLCQVK